MHHYGRREWERPCRRCQAWASAIADENGRRRVGLANVGKANRVPSLVESKRDVLRPVDTAADEVASHSDQYRIAIPVGQRVGGVLVRRDEIGDGVREALASAAAEL